MKPGTKTGSFRIRSVLMITFMGAFFLPCFILSLFYVEHLKKEEVDRNEVFSEMLFRHFKTTLDLELNDYRRVLRSHCPMDQASGLTNSPLLVCGRIDSLGHAILFYQKDPDAGFLSLKSLEASSWWQPKKMAGQAQVKLGVETSIPPPYFRKFILVTESRSDGTIFGLFDSLRLMNSFAGIVSTFEQIDKRIPILLSEQNRVIFSPESSPVNAYFKTTKLDVSQPILVIAQREYHVWQKSFQIESSPIHLALLRNTADIDLGHERAVILVLFSLGLIILLGIIGAVAMQRMIATPIVHISNAVEAAAHRFNDLESTVDPLEEALVPSYIHETNGLGRGLTSLFHALKERDLRLGELNKELIETKAIAKVGEVAEQVGHDIGSPLAALEYVANAVNELPEQLRILIRSSVSRISDIANDLLSRNKERLTQPDLSKTPTLSSQLLSSLIHPSVAEKRFRRGVEPEVEIVAEINSESYGLFAKIDPTEFKRILSNLIDNAIDALEKKGRIVVDVTGRNGRVEISVCDNGRGISPDLLPKIAQRGVTHGKRKGSGLGLYHARTCMEAWGGNLEITSKVGTGTRVVLSLPQEKPPAWFVHEIRVITDMKIIVLDDDRSIHSVWQGRLEQLGAKEKGIELLHFTLGEDFVRWYLQHRSENRILCLIDYELLEQRSTGLDIIERLNLGDRAILVTSRYEKESIRKRCETLGVRLIPKGLAGFVPISVGEGIDSAWDCILIDDDPLVEATWQMEATRCGKKLLSLPSPHSFWDLASSLRKDIPIYVDVSLGEDVRGEEFAKTLSDGGFTNLYLATAYPEELFAHLTYIKKVVGKSPPWV